MAEVERHWFRRALGGRGRPAALLRRRRAPRRRLRAGGRRRLDGRPRHVAGRSATRPAPSRPRPSRSTRPASAGANRVSLRWIMLHMIEEYARHNGHADLIREMVDGTRRRLRSASPSSAALRLAPTRSARQCVALRCAGQPDDRSSSASPSLASAGSYSLRSARRPLRAEPDAPLSRCPAGGCPPRPDRPCTPAGR